MAETDAGSTGPLPFGVSTTTGKPLPPVDAASIEALAIRESPPTVEHMLLEGRAALPEDRAFAVIAEVDERDLGDAGWGVVIARTCDSDVRAALQPLLDRRRQEAGARFRIFEGDDAPAPGETAADWLGRHHVSLDIVDPANGVPFYLLLVGSPDAIPFEFQYVLDIFWAVGRLCLGAPEEYLRYARSVVTYETAATVPTRRQIALYATDHDFDIATQQFAAEVAHAFADTTGPHGALGQRQGFALQPFIGDAATKEQLTKILRGDIVGGPPAVLFSGTHGVEGDPNDPHQDAIQGALVCQEWRGYGSIAPSDWFAANEVPTDARVHGLIHFSFACHSAGCPTHDTYARVDGAPRRIAAQPMIARLPQALLAHAAGGALACLGHIDRAFGYSFLSATGGSQAQGFRDVLARILKGDRIGYATDQFNTRWAARSVELSEMLADRSRGDAVPDALLAHRWTARDDARNYLILGDPAVRLRVEDMPRIL